MKVTIVGGYEEGKKWIEKQNKRREQKRSATNDLEWSIYAEMVCGAGISAALCVLMIWIFIDLTVKTKIILWLILTVVALFVMIKEYLQISKTNLSDWKSSDYELLQTLAALSIKEDSAIKLLYILNDDGQYHPESFFYFDNNGKAVFIKMDKECHMIPSKEREELIWDQGQITCYGDFVNYRGEFEEFDTYMGMWL